MNNTYGNIRSANIDIAHDVEIFYYYRPTLNSADAYFDGFRKIDNPSSILTKSVVSSDALNNKGEPFPDATLTGMYNLALPASIFGDKGFYTVYIRPKEIYCTILDVGVLAAYPDMAGLVLSKNSFEGDYRDIVSATDGLNGYRIDYLAQGNNDVWQRQEYYRIVTSSNLCEAVTQNMMATYSNSTAYRLTQAGSLLFLTVTPSTTQSFKANATPYIGAVGQNIILSNTKFDPVCIRLEVCENDFDTLATSLDGNQIRSLDTGVLSTYNDDMELFKQYEFFTLKDNFNQNERFEVKRKRIDNIDNSIDATEIFNQ